ncbi:sigma-70 family RNA polymerase sigma factor [Mameliella sp. CS4]|uniref:RNA polymerase sigma factor n=1 Tax=Mameliella sp. CS4 TaxID=2862329 RepID=UPI001C5E87FD|nr:sigma-70 family RNA polymerase sigma factor [Mameliella sp. CS4]MBW4985262.1 sigma-70 family RNA polymerase sigma factor [Mameliella sp. CS4]
MNSNMEEQNSQTSTATALIEGRRAFLGFLAKRLGNRADAEDVLQDFCIRVLTRKDQLRDVERMDAWLYTVLRSTLNDHYRKGNRRNRLAAAAVCEPEEWVADAPTQMARLCTCHGGLISELRPADAELIRRIDFGEEDRGMVAADLGLSRNALGVRLHRARTALRDALTTHCGKCCQDDRDDCYCPPEGCENDTHKTYCEEEGQVF